MMQPALDRGRSYIGESGVGWLRIMARLQPGVDEAQARAWLALRLEQIEGEPNGIAQFLSFEVRK